MVERESHESLVGNQFGAQAAAYLESAVHAAGADLQTLAALTVKSPAARVLDLGCGAGHVSFHVAPHVREIIAYDLSPEMLAVVAGAAAERGLANIRTQQGMVERLPFADESFDFVLSRFSAHHWCDFESALREAARVLKRGGTVGIVDAISPGPALLDTYLQATELLRDPSHVRDRSRAEWEEAFVRAGFLPSMTAAHRLRLEFASWVARIRTPLLQIDAIRALHAAMPESVARHFAVEPDGSFCLDVAFFQAAKAGG